MKLRTASESVGDLGTDGPLDCAPNFDRPSPMREQTKTLDPGIRDVVLRLNAAGFVTTDSGDGASKPDDWYASGEAIPIPHVVISTDPERMIADAHRAALVLGDDWTVEVSYETRTQTVHLFARQLTLPEREVPPASANPDSERNPVLVSIVTQSALVRRLQAEIEDERVRMEARNNSHAAMEETLNNLLAIATNTVERLETETLEDEALIGRCRVTIAERDATIRQRDILIAEFKREIVKNDDDADALRARLSEVEAERDQLQAENIELIDEALDTHRVEVEQLTTLRADRERMREALVGVQSTARYV